MKATRFPVTNVVEDGTGASLDTVSKMDSLPEILREHCRAAPDGAPPGTRL